MKRFAYKTLRVLDFLVIFMILFSAPGGALAAPAGAAAARPALADQAQPTDASTPAPVYTPTIASDKPDYSAGSTVTLTGAGWAPGDAVHIVVNDTVGQTWQHVVDVTADGNGAFTDVFSLPGYFVSDYDVTATGSSGTATTSFTDAPAAVNLDQCRNGSAASPNDCKDFGGNTGWVNGNVGASQAHMLEGYSTPFRAVMTNLPTGSSITLILGYDIRNSGANAYDYLTQYQNLDPHAFFGHPAETVYPTDGVTGLSATVSTFPIPAPSSAGSPVAGQPTASFNSLPAAERVMTLFGGTITAMSYVSQGSLTASQSETQISVTFTVDNPTAVLAWGGHISQCSVWGTTNGVCNSAGGISGSPYHMRLISWGPNLPNLGNTDKSMAASVVVQPGNLTLAKSLTGGPAGYTGPFTINYDCGTGYTGSVSVSAGSSQTINGIPSGSVCTISETLPTPPAGYTFGTPTFSPSNTVTIGQGTTVTVTTNNTLNRDLGSLKLSKSLSGGPSGYTGPFTINYDCGTGYTGSVSVSAGSSQTVSGIPTGTSCTVSETLPTPPAGYTFGTPTFSPSATVTISSVTTVEVTTNNTLTRDTGTLTIAKTLSNPDGASVPASFTINYDCGTGYTGSVSVAAGGSQTVSGIPTGNTCTVSEAALTPIAGYTWGTPTVTPASVVIADTTSTFTLTVANSITRDLGSLVLAKSLSGGPSGYTGPFTINYDCGTGYTGSVSVSAGSSQTVSGIPTGTSCTVSETLPTPPTGYSFGTPTFSPSATVTIPAGNGSSVTVTTNNTLTRDTGSLQILKTLSNPDGASVPASFTINYDCGVGYTGSVSVAAGGSQTVSGIPTGNTCTVSEAALTPIPGYTWGTPSVTPASVVITDTTSTFTLTVANSITRDRGSLTIAKTLSNPGGASVPASFTINYDCGTGYTGSVTVAAGGSQTVSGIPTGNTCTVSEAALTPIAGYTWGTPTVTPASVVIADTTGTFTLTVANSITRDLGSLVLAKSLSGGPSGYTGPFTINYDCGTGYTGSVSVSAGSSQTVSGIPTGTSCTVSETLPTPPPGYSFGTPTFSPSATVTIPAGNGSSVTVTTNNTLTRDTGSLQILKTLSNPDGASVPASFTVNYDCGTGYTGQVSVAPGSPATVNNIPTGNTCTVTEVAPAPIAGYTWGTVSYTPASVTIDTKGGTFSITVGNSITRDRGSLTIVKKVINDNGGTATVSAFGLNTSAGGLTFDSGVANGTTTTYTSQKITVVTGNYTLKENDVYGYTEGAWSCTNGTANPTTYNNGSVNVDKDKDVVCTITNNDQPGTIVIIKNAKPAQGSFAFTTTGTGYNGFTLTGATTNNGNVNTQTLNAGTYTVKEGTQLSWTLTGIGGSTDPNTPYNCVVTGSGGSNGVGDLNTQTATINLKNGDTVTCTFENTGNGATRTQGFWATHPQLAAIAWNGGSAYGHTFPGVAAVLGDTKLCGRTLTIDASVLAPANNSSLMGAFWSSVSTKTTGAKRTSLDQARMQLLQQLIAAELNASAFGSAPSGGAATINSWEAAYCGTNQTAIKNAQQGAASFNTNGDSSTFTPGTSADSKFARFIANLVFWNTLP